MKHHKQFKASNCTIKINVFAIFVIVFILLCLFFSIFFFYIFFSVLLLLLTISPQCESCNTAQQFLYKILIHVKPILNSHLTNRYKLWIKVFFNLFFGIQVLRASMDIKIAFNNSFLRNFHQKTFSHSLYQKKNIFFRISQGDLKISHLTHKKIS